MTELNLDNLTVMTEEQVNLIDRERGLKMLEAVKRQIDAGFINAAKSTLNTAIAHLSK